MKQVDNNIKKMCFVGLNIIIPSIIVMQIKVRNIGSVEIL
jgi:hypothetical protein